jgi:hypothetical protein
MWPMQPLFKRLESVCKSNVIIINNYYYVYTWTHGNFIQRPATQQPAAAVLSRIAALPSKSHKRFGGP